MGNNLEAPASREETEEQGNSQQRRSKYSKHKDDCDFKQRGRFPHDGLLEAKHSETERPDKVENKVRAILITSLQGRKLKHEKAKDISRTQQC